MVVAGRTESQGSYSSRLPSSVRDSRLLQPQHQKLYRRVHAMVDIGECLLVFTIEQEDGAFAPRVRIFDLHSHAWLPFSVPVRPARIDNGESGGDLPIDGRWQMQLIDYTTILCIYTSPSAARLIYLHVDRSPTHNFPLSIFVTHSHDIRPKIAERRDCAYACTVLYDRDESSGEERVTVVTDDYQADRDSVRLFELTIGGEREGEERGEMEEFGVCNLTDTTDDLILARDASTGDVIMVKKTKSEEGIRVERASGREAYVAVAVESASKGRGEEEEEETPVFDDCSFFPLSGRSHCLDSAGRLWTLEGRRRLWSRVGTARFYQGLRLSSLSFSPRTGRVLGVAHETHQGKEGEGEGVAAAAASTTATAHWRQLQPARLTELALLPIHEALRLRSPSARGELAARLTAYRSGGYDTTVAFVRALLEGATSDD